MVVIPAKAGIQYSQDLSKGTLRPHRPFTGYWMPAFAGMTAERAWACAGPQQDRSPPQYATAQSQRQLTRAERDDTVAQ